MRFDDSRVRLASGDVALVRGPDHYTVAGDPATAPQVIVDADQVCTTIGDDYQYDIIDLGMRTWGNDPDGPTRMLTGTYNLQSEVSGRLLSALPSMVHLAGREWRSPLIPLLAEEVMNDEPGQDVILDRLLDLLLMSAVRAWFAKPESAAPGWFLAQSDPAVGSVLRMVYDDPARPWTVATLAEQAGMSRAALARRFSEIVGEPPMTFLTNWRLTLAADLLCEPDMTIGAVASQVGYASPYALSAASKRVRGVSPRDHRLARAS